MNPLDRTRLPPASNPFSTRCIRPQAVAFLFPDGFDAGWMVDRLRRAGWRGQIVGPHGSGKTTLLHALAPAIERAGRRVVWHTFHAHQRCLPVLGRSARTWDRQAQVVIDGFEQIGWAVRWWLKHRCRIAGAGLVVTAHRDVGLPELWTTGTSESLLQTLVERLVPENERWRITDADIARAYREHEGNLREALLALYDVFEGRR